MPCWIECSRLRLCRRRKSTSKRRPRKAESEPMKWQVWDARCLKCSAFLIETPGPLCLSLTCPDCQGLNIFRDSTKPVEYLVSPQIPQEAVFSNRINIEQRIVVDEPQMDVPASS